MAEHCAKQLMKLYGNIYGKIICQGFSTDNPKKLNYEKMFADKAIVHAKLRRVCYCP